jgi:hypothetical protein
VEGGDSASKRPQFRNSGAPGAFIGRLCALHEKRRDFLWAAAAESAGPGEKAERREADDASAKAFAPWRKP